MKSNLPLDKIYSRVEDHNKYLYGKIFVSKLLSLVTISDLRRLLNAPLYSIEKLVNEPSYISFSIPKKRGGSRWIQSPDTNLMSIQSRLNFYLQQYYYLIRPRGIHGFVINPNKKKKICNIVENAKVHINQKYVLNLDLKDFFPSIKAYRVKELFESEHFKFSERLATAITLLVTYKGKLPIGAPTSPVISNFICLELDSDLIDFCNKNQLNYSRYADDLTFSSNKEILKENIIRLFEIIKKNNFEVNSKKTRLKSNNRKQTVTGLIVNEKVNVDRKIVKMVRAMLFDASKNGIARASSKHSDSNNVNSRDPTCFLNRLKGYINFITQVRGIDDQLVLKFRSDFNKLSKF